MPGLFEFGLSYAGLAAAILLFLVGGIIVWIGGANVRSAAKGASAMVRNNGVNLAKQRLSESVPSFSLRSSAVRYFANDVSRGTVWLDVDSFVSDSIYHVSRALFFAHMAVRSNDAQARVLRAQFLIKAFCLFASVNAIWLLVANMWVVACAVIAIIAFVALSEGIVMKSAVAAAIDFAESAIEESSQKAVLKGQVHRFAKWMGLYFVWKYATCFSQPFIDLIAFMRPRERNAV